MLAKLAAWVHSWRIGLIAGAGAWLALAVISVLYARGEGQKPLEALVTWDEWAVAILLLPWMFRGLISTATSFSRNSRRTQGVTMVAMGLNQKDVEQAMGMNDTGEGDVAPIPWVTAVTMAAWVVFLLDLVVRGVFGLGWQPFL